MENLTALNVLNLLPSNFMEAENFKAQLTEQIFTDESLEFNEVLSTINISVKLLAEITKTEEFKRALLSEMQEEKEDYKYYSITQKYTKRFNFATCNDFVYNDLTEKMESLKNQIKAREKFLKAIPEEGTVDPSTGEVIEVPESSSTLAFMVKFKKPKQDLTGTQDVDKIFNTK